MKLHCGATTGGARLGVVRQPGAAIFHAGHKKRGAVGSGSTRTIRKRAGMHPFLWTSVADDLADQTAVYVTGDQDRTNQVGSARSAPIGAMA
jgi:hypothetical protein